MTENSSSKLHSPKFVALYLIISLWVIILFPIVGPFLVAFNKFNLADRLSFLPGINGSGGKISGISTAIYIIGGFLLVVGSVMVATGAVPEIGGPSPGDGIGSVTPTATATPIPQQVSDTRKQEYKVFVQRVDSYSARSPRTWSAINKTTLNMTVQSDWAKSKEYSNHKHPVPESVLRAMNATKNPPKRVVVNFENESGGWLRTVKVKKEWADPFVGYELGIDAMQKRFRKTTITSEEIPKEASIPRFHITIDDVRRAYANRVAEKFTNRSWEPEEFNTSEFGSDYRPTIGNVGLHNQTAYFQNSDKTISGKRVIKVEIIQKKSGIGHNSLGWMASGWADVVKEQPYGVLLGEPGLVLQVQYVNPDNGQVYLTTNIPSTWAQHYNADAMDWGNYINTVALNG